MTPQEFKTWRASQSSFLVFFDGASNNNPRVACGGGRVLFTTPRDNMKVIFHEVLTFLQII
jgi:hypothetical protein